MTLRLLILCALLIPASGTPAADSKLPFTAEVLVEELEKYEADIQKRADELIATKRKETIAKLKVEAAKQSKSGNADAARAILTVVEDWQKAADEAEAAAALASRRWTPLFEEDNLPAKWAMAEEPDGGWDYRGGVLEMRSLKKYAAALHEVPAGNIVVRAKVKLEADGDESKEQQAGIGFISSKDNLILAIAQAPGAVLAYGNVGPGEKLLGMEASTACQGKFTEIQVAWVGTKFMIFARDKLLVDVDVKVPRGDAGLALSCNNATGSFREVEVRVPDRDDLERLKGGRALN